MTDWSGAAIGLITAGAALGGNYLAGHLSLKALAKSHGREDAIFLRLKVEELFGELDRIQGIAAINGAEAITAIHNKKAPDERLETINLGKVRALVSLYFPDCWSEIEAFDKREAEGIATLRQGLEDKVMDVLTASMSHIAVRGMSIGTLCDGLRKLLVAQANKIGAPVSQA